MKCIIVLLISCLIAYQSNAQKFTIKPFLEIVKDNKFHPPFPPAKYINPKAINTRVIILPIDNMPCLVAGESSVAVMPVLKTPLTADGIPNAFFKCTIIPATTAK